MRNVLRNTVAALGIGLSAIAAATLVYAQIIPSTSTTQRHPVPRYFQTQQVHYVRSTLTFNMCTAVSNVCTFQLANASLPYNALVLRVTYAIYTAFNSTTSDTLSIGTTSANANELVAALTIHASALTSATVVTPGSMAATGNATAQSGQNGGFDLWAKWTAGTGNTATTGLMAVIIEYVAPNDGLCAPVPMGATAVGC